MARRKGKKRISVRRALDLGVQILHVQRRFPTFSCHRKNGRRIWSGPLQPRLTSPSYQVEIEYRHHKPPRVKVLSPRLVAGTPHLYKDGSLCLYWPKEWHWQDDELLAETIIPWAALWLYYYELWLDTGQWLGPSSHDQFPETDNLE